MLPGLLQHHSRSRNWERWAQSLSAALQCVSPAPGLPRVSEERGCGSLAQAPKAPQNVPHLATNWEGQGDNPYLSYPMTASNQLMSTKEMLANREA